QMAADVSTSATKSFAPEKPVGSRFEVLLVWTKSDRLNDTFDCATGNWLVGAIAYAQLKRHREILSA
ncbi:MAG: hypothetical protein KJO67_14015, partial [Silicimonas sp.]|nr:hypothetical protein [Silicimonas sp.]